MFGQNIAHARQCFVTGNQLNFAGLNLRDPLADFVDVRALNFRGDIICQTRDQTLRQLNTRFRR